MARPARALRIKPGIAANVSSRHRAIRGSLWAVRSEAGAPRPTDVDSPAREATGFSALNDSPRDFVFVRDAARACLALAEEVKQTGHSIDHAFRSGWEFTERTLAEFIAPVNRRVQ